MLITDTLAKRAAVLALLLLCGTGSAAAQSFVHGLWVWKSPTVLAAPHAAEALRDFCKSQHINEVYVSISESSKDAEESELVHLIQLLHGEDIHVEALLSSAEADEPGKHRETLLRHVQGILDFNRKHSAAGFDGIHLDVEPWQRPENKGSGNLAFLPGLAAAYRDVRRVAERTGLTVNADILTKLLKGDQEQRRTLLSSVPRLTLMMYELNNPSDGATPAQKAAKVASSSANYLAMAYDGLSGDHLAKIAIALRTADYEALLPEMLRRLDDANHSSPHYLGWARHSYNDTLK